MARSEEDDLAGVFDEMQRGDPDAEAHLFARVYDMLRKMAHRRLAGEPPDATLQTTILVHEARRRKNPIQEHRENSLREVPAGRSIA